MNNDKRTEFEADYVLVYPNSALFNDEELKRKRCTRQGVPSYADEYLRGLYIGWCLAKDADIKRHEAYTASLIVKADANPTVQTYSIIRTQTGKELVAPEGFAWGVNFVTSCQWPESVTMDDGVKYTLHDAGAVPYVDVILFQVLHVVSVEARLIAKCMYKQLSDGFHVKTHFDYDDGELHHELTRLTIYHADFVELQHV